MFSAKVTRQGFNVIAYIVVWPFRTVQAAWYALGLAGTVDAEQVVRLVQKQQTRIAAALR
jgi:hypothetical protein